jgi:hypothetical protein
MQNPMNLAHTDLLLKSGLRPPAEHESRSLRLIIITPSLGT